MRFDLLANHRRTIPALAALLRQTWPDACPADADAGIGLVASWSRRHALPVGFVALDNTGSPVGLACVEAGTAPDETPVRLLSAMLVTPRARGCGVGRGLCDGVRTWWARRHALEPLHLYTEDAESFFLRLGWEVVAPAITYGGTKPRAVTFMREPARTLPRQIGSGMVL